MRKKRLHLILGLVLTMLVGLLGSPVSAVRFKINFGDKMPARAGYMRMNIVSIHFNDNGNDFGGFIYFSNGMGSGEDLSDFTGKYEVKLDGNTFLCQQMAKGFYYNAERGERLWPLDDSYSVSALSSISGGLYTRCSKEGFEDAMKNCGQENDEAEREQCEEEARNKYVDKYGYYGMLLHKYGNHEFFLAAGTNYFKSGTINQIIMGTEFAPTLIRFANKYPVGFIYDANGGLGFVGGEITYSDDDALDDILDKFNEKQDWTDLFYLSGDGIWSDDLPIDTTKGGSAKNSLISVVVDGLVGINRDDSMIKNSGIQGNQSNDKMQYFASVDINNMQLINYAKQKAEILCRGKWKKYNNGLDFEPGKSLHCFDSAGSTILAKTGTTIIVKGPYDVEVQDMSNFDNGGYYDIFVDGGDLIINEVTESGDLKVFKNNGFISDMTVEDFSRYAFPILNGTDSYYTGDEVVAGKFIKGNFIVNGNIKSKSGSGFNHVYFIYGKMTSKDSVDQLGEVFKWRCQVGIQGTDGTPCPGAEKDVYGNVNWINPYENASLVIIDQNYPSPLYQ